jgi:hypothetical protein
MNSFWLTGGKGKNIAAALFILAAAGFMLLGLERGEVAVVFQRAIRICLQCIGIG